MSRPSMSGLAHELYTSPRTERILEYATKVYRTARFRQRGRVVEVCIEALRLTFKLTDAELKEVRTPFQASGPMKTSRAASHLW